MTSGTPPRSPGRAPYGQVPAYLLTGLLLLLLSGVVLAWVGRGLRESSSTAPELLEALFNGNREISASLLSPYEWAFAAALLLVGALALAQRLAARGGALLIGWLLLALSTREAVGLLDSAYRARSLDDALGRWLLATRVTELLVGALVLALMLRASALRTPFAARAAADNELFGPREPYGSARPQRLAYTVSGLTLLLYGALETAWIGRRIAQRQLSVDAYLRRVLDPASLPGPAAPPGEFLALAFAMTFLLLGALLLARRPAARAAAVTLLAVQLYLNLRFVVTVSLASPTDDGWTSWQDVTDGLEGQLYLGTVAFGLLAALAVPLALRAAARSAD